MQEGGRKCSGLLQPTTLTSSGPKAKQTASVNGFTLHNHDPVPKGERRSFFISTPYSLWLLSFRLQAMGVRWVSICTSHLERSDVGV